MASEPDVSEISQAFERMVRNRDMALFLPFVFGLSNAASRREGEDSGQENHSEQNPQPERIILINPFTQGMVVIDGASSLEALFPDLASGKGGRPPASRESIDALPSVKIEEGHEGECVICLEEWEAGEVVKEMPCKHKFHPNCVEKWWGFMVLAQSVGMKCLLMKEWGRREMKRTGKRGGEELEEKYGLVSFSMVKEEVRTQIRLLQMIPMILHQVQEVMLRLQMVRGGDFVTSCIDHKCTKFEIK